MENILPAEFDDYLTHLPKEPKKGDFEEYWILCSWTDDTEIPPEPFRRSYRIPGSIIDPLPESKKRELRQKHKDENTQQFAHALQQELEVKNCRLVPENGMLRLVRK